MAAGDLTRILRLLHDEQGFTPAQCERIQGALRAYEYPLLRAVRAELQATTLFEQVLERLSLSVHLPKSPLSQAWSARILDRGALENFIRSRESEGQQAIEQILFTSR